jgi:tripartite-type tricarboxylate transporter receptor subunit TctC
MEQELNDHGRERRWVLAATAAVLLVSSGSAALAQADFPARPIRVLVGAPPGGGTDAIARVFAEAAGVWLKQSVIVDNRPGANGIIASEALARAPADGYTLALVQNTHTINPAIFKKLPYDTLKDFTPIGPIGRSPLALVASASTNVKSLKDLTEFAKRDPSGLSFGSAEASIQLATETIRAATKLPITLVPYKGTAPAITDIAGGHLNFAVTTISSTMAHKTSGKLNYIAVLARERSPFLPDVPTLAEQGHPDVQAEAWWGFIGPANLPRSVIQKLNDSLAAALAEAAVRQKLATVSVEPWKDSSDNFEKFLRNDAAVMAKLARQAGIQPE